MIKQKEFRKRTEHIGQLVERVTRLQDAEARSTAQELLQTVMDLHGAVLERVLELIAAHDKRGNELLGALARDPLVSGLLVLYDLHPEKLEARVARALENLHGFLRSHSGSVELLEIRDGVVRLRLGVRGCASTSAALKEAVEQAIYEAAPETAGIFFEEAAPVVAGGFIPLAKLTAPAA
jgi:Fe-S cluster biogenesis protein NfuA